MGKPPKKPFPTKEQGGNPSKGRKPGSPNVVSKQSIKTIMQACAYAKLDPASALISNLDNLNPESKQKALQWMHEFIESKKPVETNVNVTARPLIEAPTDKLINLLKGENMEEEIEVVEEEKE